MHAAPAHPAAASLRAILGVSFLASLGTGIFWHGIAFIAKEAYGFGEGRNLVLYAAMGALYTVGALRAGWLIRVLRARLSMRGVLALMLALQAASCAAPVAIDAEWALWAASAVLTIASSITWPIVESYLTAARHGPAMRRAIGWFNLVWMSAMPVAMFGMAPLLEHHGRWALGGIAIAAGLALTMVPALPRRPAAHDLDAALGHVGAEYALLLRSARILLPLSYVITSATAPILPYRFDELAVPIVWQTPLTSTWMTVRVLALLVMWRLPFWHGRWGTLLLGALAMSGGFAMIVMSPHLGLMLAGLAALGVGLGIVYYAALYYAMSVGHAEVEAGATHEALIGAGYAAGPLAALTGRALAGAAGAAAAPAIVGVVWVIVALGAGPAIMPYVTARRKRRRQGF